MDIKLTDVSRNVKMLDGIDVEIESCMFVDLITNRGVLQFTAYNNHNGYYGHDAKVISTQLNHKCSL